MAVSGREPRLDTLMDRMPVWNPWGPLGVPYSTEALNNSTARRRSRSWSGYEAQAAISKSSAIHAPNIFSAAEGTPGELGTSEEPRVEQPDPDASWRHQRFCEEEPRVEQPDPDASWRHQRFCEEECPVEQPDPDASWRHQRFCEEVSGVEQLDLDASWQHQHFYEEEDLVELEDLQDLQNPFQDGSASSLSYVAYTSECPSSACSAHCGTKETQYHDHSDWPSMSADSSLSTSSAGAAQCPQRGHFPGKASDGKVPASPGMLVVHSVMPPLRGLDEEMEEHVDAVSEPDHWQFRLPGEQGCSFAPEHQYSPRQQGAEEEGDTRDAPAGSDGQAGGEGPTTWIILNLPRNIFRARVTRELDADGFAEAYDFVHVPRDYKAGINNGHAFVNFVSSEAAERFRREWDGNHHFASKDPLRIKAAKIQGSQACQEHHSGKRRTNTRALRPFVIPRG